MNYLLIIKLLLASTFLIGIPWEPNSWLLNFLAILASVCIAVEIQSILTKRFFYLATLLGIQLIIFLFFLYIYNNHELVIRSKAFVFSTFYPNNIKKAIDVSLASILAIFFPWLLCRESRSTNNTSIVQFFQNIFGAITNLSPTLSTISLVLSFLFSFFVFSTCTSVLEMPYPFNTNSIWLPVESIKIGYGLSFLAYLSYISKNNFLPGVFKFKLLLSRINLIISPILLLLILASRGLISALWLIAGLIEIGLFRKRRGSWLWGVTFIVFSWVVYMSWPYFRSHVAYESIENTVSQSISLAFLISGVSEGSSGAETSPGINLLNYPMIGQSLFHMLYTIELVKQNVSLNGSTFINLIPQSLPSFLDGIFWSRPLNDNWLLGEHYHHGGGFLIMANAYWNGGIWVASLFMGILSWVVITIDRYLSNNLNSGIFLRLNYWLWLSVFAIQITYGIQGLIRVLQFLFVLILFDKYCFKGRSRKNIDRYVDIPLRK